jgi:hypothetical protein
MLATRSKESAANAARLAFTCRARRLIFGAQTTNRSYSISNDKETEIKAQKPNAATIETSQARIPTYRLVGPRRAAPLTGCQK